MSVPYVVERIFEINRRVTVVILKGHYAGRYSTRIEDIGERLLLAAPTHRGAVIRLSEGEPVRVEILAEDAVYAFDTYVDSMALEPIPVIGVSKPENLARIQRREFVRVDLNLPVKYRPLTLIRQKPLEYQSADIVNLSGGGASIVTWHPLQDKGVKSGSELQLELELPDGNKVEVKAVIVRISDTKTEKGIRHKIAVMFTEIDERQQDVIVRYVLECQYEMRRKGLL
jgi:c-di-GMP-binding flagellar brake protein YcgR